MRTGTACELWSEVKPWTLETFRDMPVSLTMTMAESSSRSGSPPHPFASLAAAACTKMRFVKGKLN